MKITRYGFLVLAVLALAGLLNAQTYTGWGDGAKPEESKTLVKPTAAGPGANVTGQDNVAVGGDAGRLTESGVENKDPTGSVYIGAFTRGKAPGVVNEIVIGHSAVGAGSNTVTIGNASTTATYLKGNVVIPGVATIATPTLNIHASNKGYVDALVVSLVGAVSIPGNASFTLSGLGSKAFTELTGIPTTIAGYGLTDAASTTALSDHTGATTGVHGAPANTRFLTASETIDASQIPSEIARDTEIPNPASFTLGGLGTKAFSELTDIPTTIADYGLTDAASTTALSDHTGATTGVHGAPADTRFLTASETIPIANGGTGATSAADARIALSVYSRAEVQAIASGAGGVYAGIDWTASGSVLDYSNELASWLPTWQNKNAHNLVGLSGLVDGIATATGHYRAGANTAGSGAFFGAVMLQTGEVCFVPHNSDVIGLYNPTYNTYRSGPVAVPADAAFMGGVLMPNGNVCLVPCNSDYVGIYDPIANTYTQGPLATSTNDASYGGVLMSDGNVLLVPASSNRIGVYYPRDNTYASGPSTVSAGGSFIGGVALPDGRILLVPFTATKIGLYDPSDGTYENGPDATGFNGGVLMPNGKVCLVPCNSDYVGIYDPEANTYTQGPAITTKRSGQQSFWGGVLLPNGKVLFVPTVHDYVGLYDPDTNTYVNGPSVGVTSFAWVGGVLTHTGQVVFASANNGTAGLFTMTGAAPLDIRDRLHPMVNKF